MSENGLPEGFEIEQMPAPAPLPADRARVLVGQTPAPFVPEGFTPDQPIPPPSPSAELFRRNNAPSGLSGLVAGQAVPDKYQQAAIAERDRRLTQGAPLDEGYTRRLMSGPLLGWQDEIGAGMATPFEMIKHKTWDPSEGYAYGRARERLTDAAARENTGYTGDAAALVGGLATLPGNFFGRQASIALGGAQAGIKGIMGRILGYGSEGATLGAVGGAGSAETMRDIPKEAGKGAAVGGLVGAAVGPFGDLTPRSAAATPTKAELNTLGAADYAARDALPVSYDLERVGDRLRAERQNTRNTYGRDAPLTSRQLQDLADETASDVAAARAANPPPNQITPSFFSGAPNRWDPVATPRDIVSLKKEIYETGARGSATDERAAVGASGAIHDILRNPDPATLARGVDPRDAAAAALLDTRGRGNFASAFRDQTVREVIDKTVAQAAGQHSGLNFENLLRQNLRQARAKDEFGTLSPEEEAHLERLIVGTTKANNMRELGNMLGGGGGLGRMVAMGGGGATGAIGAYLYGGDPLYGAISGVALGTGGRMIRSYGNAQARRGVESFSEAIRQRSPEYIAREARAPFVYGPGVTSSTARGVRTGVATDPDIRDAIAKALIYNTTGERQ